MNVSDIETFVSQLADVQRTDDWGYIFYFVGDDHRLPFVSLSDSDNEYDSVSNLNRDDVFRLNIGVSRDTFKALVGDATEPIDYAALNVFLPHPEYAKQNFVCILNPSGANAERAKELMLEAHAIATKRAKRVQKD
jgi:hypothetical protein